MPPGHLGAGGGLNPGLPPMRVNLVYARARNGVIGRGGAMPWHLPQDLAHFKQLTAGCPVIMGRKTWDSLPVRFRPLPGRTNLVVTRQASWSAPGAQAAGSLEQALDHCRQMAPQPADVWVIGGAELYRLALPLATRVEVTEVDADIEGDTFMPPLPPQWQAVARMAPPIADALPFVFVSYLANPPPKGI